MLCLSLVLSYITLYIFLFLSVLHTTTLLVVAQHYPLPSPFSSLCFLFFVFVLQSCSIQKFRHRPGLSIRYYFTSELARAHGAAFFISMFQGTLIVWIDVTIVTTHVIYVDTLSWIILSYMRFPIETVVLIRQWKLPVRPLSFPSVLGYRTEVRHLEWSSYSLLTTCNLASYTRLLIVLMIMIESNAASAFAGAFWDPGSNRIIISFSPIEFEEWLSDLVDAWMVESGTIIPARVFHPVCLASYPFRHRSGFLTSILS